MKAPAVALATIAVVGLVVGVWAQQPTFKRTVLQQADISVPGREAAQERCLWAGFFAPPGRMLRCPR